MAKNNPNYTYGKIYDYLTKEFMTRDDFIKNRFTKEGIMKKPIERNIEKDGRGCRTGSFEQ